MDSPLFSDLTVWSLSTRILVIRSNVPSLAVRRTVSFWDGTQTGIGEEENEGEADSDTQKRTLEQPQKLC